MLSTVPYHKFKIAISTEEYNAEDEDNGLSCQLVFTYTDKYPDTAPLVEIEDSVNFDDGYESKLLEHVQETVRNRIYFLIYDYIIIKSIIFYLLNAVDRSPKI